MQFVKDSVFSQRYPSERDVIDIRNYFDEYDKLIYSSEELNLDDKTKNLQENEFYRRMLDLPQELVDELSQKTSVDNLTCTGEIVPFNFRLSEKPSEFSARYDWYKSDAEEPVTLTSVQRRLETKPNTRETYTKDYLKYEQYQFCDCDKLTNYQNDLNPFDHKTIIICVKVYHSILSYRSAPMKIKLLQEIHILGDQFLSQLRDEITCPMDYVGIKDSSTDCFLKEVGLKLTAKDLYPSSFIFVENTFYNDTRNENLKDLSKAIRDWGVGRGLGPFETASMEGVKMADVPLRLGRPYVFQHQGNCEHILVFSDVRFITTSDMTRSQMYPIVYATGRSYAKYCMMCGHAYARWMVVGSKRLTHDRTYLCQKCFVSYNYVDGVKVGEFEAYEYVDAVAIL